MSFSFKHPDPDKIHRLMKKWESHKLFYQEDVQELVKLQEDWVGYYHHFGQHKLARLLTKKVSIIMRTLTCLKPVSTTRGVAYVRPRPHPRSVIL